jgi:hypothetical protein
VLSKHGVTQAAVEALGLPFPAIVTFGAVPVPAGWHQEEAAEQVRSSAAALHCWLLSSGPLPGCYTAEGHRTASTSRQA